MKTRAERFRTIVGRFDLNDSESGERSGEGRCAGFRVCGVAKEVRQLAERSAKPTEEIADLTGGNQNEVQEAVKVMERSVQFIEKGVEQSEQVKVQTEKFNSIAGGFKLKGNCPYYNSA